MNRVLKRAPLLLALMSLLLCATLAQGQTPQALIGRWTSSSPSGTGDRSLLLQPDGSYEMSGYAVETDRGRWWVDGEFFYAQSSVNGVTMQHYLQITHDEYGQPMLILDGDAYVTSTGPSF